MIVKTAFDLVIGGFSVLFSSVQLLSCVWLFVIPWTVAHQASLSITNSWSLLRLNIHWVGDAIPPSHPLSSPSAPAFSFYQHQGLFQWVSSLSGGQSIGASASASVLAMNIQDWFPLGWTGWISLQSKGLSRVFSNTTIQKYQFFILLYGPTLISMHDYWKNHSLD